MLLNIHEKRFNTISKTKIVNKKWKIWAICVSKLLFWRQKWVAGFRHGNSIVVSRVPPGAVARQIKPGILKLATNRDQRNLCTAFIFVSCEENGWYRIVSFGHQNFDCRSCCRLSRRSSRDLQIGLRIRDWVREWLFSSSLQASHYHDRDPYHPMSFPLYLNTNM